MAASCLVALALSGYGKKIPDGTGKPAVEVALHERRAPDPPDREMLRRAAEQWEAIGTDVATATRRAAETPLDVSGRLLAMKPLRDTEALQSFEPITHVLTHAGESAFESLEPIRRTAQTSLKSWWNGKPNSQ